MYYLSESMGGGVRKPIGKSNQGASRRRLEHLCGFLKSWGRKTKGCTIECQRHHLKNDLFSQFKDREVKAAIDLVFDETDGGCDVCETENTVTIRDPLNLIFECPDFAERLDSALDRQYGRPRAAETQKKSKTREGYAK